MSKTRSKSRRTIFTLICLFGISFSYSWVQARTLNTLFDNIVKEAENSKPIDKVFDWTVITENLYKKAIDMVKGQTMTTMKDSIQEVTDNISQISKKSIKAQDVMNILYDTSTAVNEFASVMNFFARWVLVTIPSDVINASYGRMSKVIPACKNMNNQDERICIKQRVGKQYYTVEKNYTDLGSFKEQNYGEDIFTNGSTDDSSYDILIDIKNIGNLLFSSFISPTETLFYKLPTSKSTSINNTLASIVNILNGNTWSQVMNTFGTTSNTSNSTTNTSTNSSSSTASTSNGTTSSTNWWTTNSSSTTDSAVDTFIKNTNTSSSTTSTTTNTVGVLWVAKGNICLPSISDTSTNTVTKEADPDVVTIQKYLDDIDAATKQTTPTNDYTPTTLPIPTDIGNASAEDVASMNQLIEDKINGIFDPESTKTCTAKCTIGTLSEQTMCKIECLCFSIEYPKQGTIGLDGLDGQLKVRFCTVPVQQNRVSKGKDIYGRDDSLSRMQAVFENLLNGWEMVKYERPKEYLDSPLWAIQWAKYISFEVKIYIKSLFSTLQNSSKKIETKNSTQKTEERTLGISSDPATDTNRNILANNLAAQKAKKQMSDSYEQTQANIATEQAKIEAMKPQNNSTLALQNSKNKKSIIFNEQMGQFLQQNSNFRFYVTEQINNFNGLSSSLKSAIKALP